MSQGGEEDGGEYVKSEEDPMANIMASCPVPSCLVPMMKKSPRNYKVLRAPRKREQRRRTTKELERDSVQGISS